LTTSGEAAGLHADGELAPAGAAGERAGTGLHGHHPHAAAQDRRGGAAPTRRVRVLLASKHPLKQVFLTAARALAP